MKLQQLLDEANAALRQGNVAQAEQRYQKILSIDRKDFMACNMLGVIRAQQGRTAEALALFGKALKTQPHSADALANCGRVLQMEGRFGEALAMYEKALAAAPSSPSAWSSYGNALYSLGRPQEALQSYDRALALAPDFSEAQYNRGLALQTMNRFDEALLAYDRAIALRPQFLEALNNRSVVLLELGRPEDAFAASDRAVKTGPQHVEAWNSRGNALQKLNRSVEALASYDRVLALRPDYVIAWNNRGNALISLKRFEEAVASFDRALGLAPGYVEAWSNRGNALKALKRIDEAIASYDRALALDPDFTVALHSRGTLAWLEKGDYQAALRDAERAFALAPDFDYAAGALLHLRMHGADWRNFEEEVAALDAGVRAGKCVVEPFVYQGLSQSPADLLACAKIFTEDRYPAAPPLWPPTHRAHRAHGKIRIGYVSGEFREQATAYLTAGLYELHDRDGFEIFAFDNGHDDGSPTRKRLEAAFDKFVDISRLADPAAAQAIGAQQIDILVNLNGYFGQSRMGVFARRPAPLQVNYLGFPGTLGADYMDYLIADRIVIPEDEQRHYSEKLVWLPDSYQVNDSRRVIAPTAPSRVELGLPEEGFVFCNFNQSYKLTPPIFAIWMRLLGDISGSVLWLYESNTALPDALRREAERQGVAAERLIFAPTVPPDQHLARIARADLFLDELPYNAHTTASDALWAGVPLLTCRGTAFAGRVATSLLQNVGLPELVTETLEDYEALARKLARGPRLLANIREKLARQRLSTPLFDTDRFRRHLEAAYRGMWERHSQGAPPESFCVPVL